MRAPSEELNVVCDVIAAHVVMVSEAEEVMRAKGRSHLSLLQEMDDFGGSDEYGIYRTVLVQWCEIVRVVEESR